MRTPRRGSRWSADRVARRAVYGVHKLQGVAGQTTGLVCAVRHPHRLPTGLFGVRPAGEAAPALTWMGPAAFQARYRDLPGIDHDFGTGWGAGGDQRISLRQDIGSERSTEAGASHVRSATSAFGEFAARRELRNVRESDKPSHSGANGTF